MTEQLSPVNGVGVESSDPIIKLVVMAVGGQGGGVLTSWIEQVARANGYAVQATSVAGVAQRTGSTIYYVEMARAGSKPPVLSLAPSAGDVDILIASEMMEAGRAIQRGFVTPDRTTLIASTHRYLAVSEKMAPGDGIADADEVIAAAEVTAQHLILGNMDRLAVEAGSVISASLFGALAGSNVLPFPREAFEQAITASGKGVEASLRAFAKGHDAATTPDASTENASARPVTQKATGPAHQLDLWAVLVQRVQALPVLVQDVAEAGLRKVVDYLDADYGASYLDHVETVLDLDQAERGYELTSNAAKYIANAMAYDDVIRVADLKTRSTRYDRIRREMGAGEETVLQLTEFMHPRAEEIVGLLPSDWGAWVEARAPWMARIDRWFNRSRRLRSDSLGAFLQLYVLGGLRRYRRRTRRHAVEQAHLKRWLQTARSYLPGDYDLAVEIIRCRRLIKGYSDTHARGLSKFDRTLEGITLVAGRDDASDWARRLREAALEDEEGKALDGTLATIRTFA